MGYTAKETRILIDFHSQYGTNHHTMKNYYLEALAELEELLPDITGEVDELTGHYDDPEHFAGKEHKEAAAELIRDKLAEWIEELEEIRQGYQGTAKTAPVYLTAQQRHDTTTALSDKIKAMQKEAAALRRAGDTTGAQLATEEAAHLEELRTYFAHQTTTP